MPLNDLASQHRFKIGNLQELQATLRAQVTHEEQLAPSQLEWLDKLLQDLVDASFKHGDVDQNLALSLFFAERAQITASARLGDTSLQGCDVCSRDDAIVAVKIGRALNDVKDQLRKVRINRGLRVPNGPR